MKILITGGAGFIGSEFVRQAVKRKYKIIVVDKLAYAGDLERLKEVNPIRNKTQTASAISNGVKGKYKFYKVSICNKKKMGEIFEKEKPQIVINFAAETHVDRSIQNPNLFLKTNILGTQVLLEISKKYKIEKFIHISSDEVYGEIKKGKFSESAPLSPNSPYAVSKAGADLLIKSYIRTYNFPAIIIRPCNNYGPWQYPEKLIPLSILKILRGEKIPIYGDGRNIREWLYIEDCADGIFQIFKKGRLGEIYNLGSGEEKQNIKVVKQILKILNRSENLIKFVKDRPGHDFRYRLNSEKIYKEIGWKPKMKFEDGLEKTVQWYLEYKNWLQKKYK
jgi:dTDP-glucose 4,6-dehydratase